MIIRLAQLKDAHEISVLSTHFGHGASPDEMHKRLTSVLNKPDHNVYVCENISGDMLGWIHACINITLGRGVYGEVLSFVVHEEFRSMGIGEKLFMQVEDWFKQFTPTSVVIRSYKQRDRAHKFYSRYGYDINQVAMEKWL